MVKSLLQSRNVGRKSVNLLQHHRDRLAHVEVSGQRETTQSRAGELYGRMEEHGEETVLQVFAGSGGVGIDGDLRETLQVGKGGQRKEPESVGAIPDRVRFELGDAAIG